MITQKMKYALKALLALADEAAKPAPEALTIEEIARRSGTPKRFLEHILLEVRNAGVIASTRGRSGGYTLIKRPSEVSISELLRAIDGPYTDFADPEGYRASARRAAALGFEGKWAIHPSQVALANEVFTPSEQAVAEAREIQENLRHRVIAEGGPPPLRRCRPACPARPAPAPAARRARPSSPAHRLRRRRATGAPARCRASTRRSARRPRCRRPCRRTQLMPIALRSLSWRSPKWKDLARSWLLLKIFGQTLFPAFW